MAARAKHDTSGEMEIVAPDLREHGEEMFDLILCRNLVFTYFTEDLQRSVLDRLTEHLKDGGFLVIGSQELIPNGSGHLVPYRYKGIYRKTSANDND